MSEFSAWMFRASGQASCLAVAVFIVQWLLGSRLSARGRCVLWLVVIGRLLLPPLPMVRWSYFHTRTIASAAHVVAGESPKASVHLDPVPMTHQKVDPARVAELRAELAAMNSTLAPPKTPLAAVPVKSAPTPAISPTTPLWPRILRALPWLWFTGAILFIARLAVASLRLSVSLRSMKPLDNPRLAAVARSTAGELGLRRIPPLLAADHFPGPAVAGWLRPRLLIPSSVATSFSDDDLRMMVMHELAHVRRRDVAINWLLSLLNAVHCFNPVLWLAFRRIRADRELACDELVMSATQTDANRRYGHTLLRLADWLAQHNPARHLATAGVLSILEDSNELKRRIVMISRFNPTKRHRFSLAASLLALLFISAALIDAAEPGAPASPQTKEATTKPSESAAQIADRLRARRTAERQMPANHLAVRVPVKQLQSTLEQKLATAREALDQQQRETDLMRRRYDAGVARAIDMIYANAQLAEARLRVTNANIALAQLTADPAKIKPYLQQRVTDAQERVKAAEEAAKVAAKMREAGIPLDAVQESASAYLSKAKQLLIDAKAAADEQAHAAASAASKTDLEIPVESDANPPRSAPDQYQKDVDTLAELEAQYAPNHPKVLALRNRLRIATITRMQQMMVAVKLYDHERGGMPKGFHIKELAEMVNFNANEDPRLPYLTYGYRWVAPDVKRLSDIKDPAHTPIFCEVTTQPDGSILVAYADGHVGEVKGDEVKKLEALDRAQHDSVAEIEFFDGETLTVPRELAAECQRIVNTYKGNQQLMEPGAARKAAREAIRQKIDQWKKARGIAPTTQSTGHAAIPDTTGIQKAQARLNALHNEGKSENHPQVMAARRELQIAELGHILQSHPATDCAKTIDELTDPQIGMIDIQMARQLDVLRQAQDNLAKLKHQFAETHPSVAAAQAEVQHAADAVSAYGNQWRSLMKKLAADSPAARRAQGGNWKQPPNKM